MSSLPQETAPGEDSPILLFLQIFLSLIINYAMLIAFLLFYPTKRRFGRDIAAYASSEERKKRLRDIWVKCNPGLPWAI